jgi:hypothetical protein
MKKGSDMTISNEQDSPINVHEHAHPDLFGAPPVLGNESAAQFRELRARLMYDLRPGNTMEEILVRQIIDSTWIIMRLLKHSNLVVERRRRDQQEKRQRVIGAENNLHQSKQNGKAGNGSAVAQLEATVDNVAKKVDDLFECAADDLAYSLAFEQSLVTYAELDRMRTAAMKARTIALEQLVGLRTMDTKFFRFAIREYRGYNIDRPGAARNSHSNQAQKPQAVGSSDLECEIACDAGGFPEQNASPPTVPDRIAHSDLGGTPHGTTRDPAKSDVGAIMEPTSAPHTPPGLNAHSESAATPHCATRESV